jgi:hypothetical protein
MSYPPYPGTPGPTGGYPPPDFASVRRPEPARGLMLATIVVASIFTALEVIEAALSWPAQSRLLDAVENNDPLDFLTPYDIVGFLWFPTMIMVYIVTCLWLHRVRLNSEALCPAVHHARKRWWVWGSWLVPFVSLGFPYQVVRDISKDEEGNVTAPRINMWWTFWLLSILIEQFGLKVIAVQASADVPDAYSGLGLIETTNAALCVIASVLWIRIIRRIGQNQDQLMGITR